MRKKSIFFKIIIFILFCFNLFAAKEKVYIIGTDVHFPPFEFKDENGVLKGIDIELLENFAKNQQQSREKPAKRHKKTKKKEANSPYPSHIHTTFILITSCYTIV